MSSETQEKTPQKRYVWLSPEGKFSNSWDEETQKKWGKDIYEEATEKGCKLIEYTVINDPEFEFYNMMRLA